MPAVKTSARGSGAVSTAGRDLRTFAAFTIVGFANTLLPYIILSSLYLIVPFPQPIVLLIELLPALAVKLLIPHTLHYTPHWVWLLLLASCWILATITANAAPPNVIAPIRISIAILASATAAVGEVFFLSRLPRCGKAALVGWGVGTAMGGALRAVMPVLVTIQMGVMLRGVTGYAYYLVASLMAGYFLVLRSSPGHRLDTLAAEIEFAAENEAISEMGNQKFSILAAGRSSSIGFWERWQRNMLLLSNKLLRLYIDPLLLVTAAQILVLSGTPRASITLPGFSGYSTFSAAYGLAFQNGNIIARSTAVLFRTRRPRLVFALLVACSLAAILNTALLLSENESVAFGLVFAVGWCSGTMYMNTFAAAMEYLSRNPEEDAEFALGSLGVGQTVGMLVGGLAGVTFEAQLCGLASRNGRWCGSMT
ncbi:Protein BTN1 [Trichoderma ghanense]|uniref:Protein BTN n=1 Tax=Trichoderma ghanense TaxID=65468 RepID=A0ABY2GZU5_9HYPO